MYRMGEVRKLIGLAVHVYFYSVLKKGGEFGSKQLEKINDCLKDVTVEPVVMLSLFAASIYESVCDDLYIVRGCSVNLRYNMSLCNNLTELHDIEVQVQMLLAPYITARQCIHASLAVVFSLFVGPWSDKYGRRVPLLVPVAATSMTAILYILFTVWEVPVEVLLIACVPAALGGGIGITIVAGHSYVCDISSHECRTMRISFLEAAATLGRTLGTLISGVLLRYLGHLSVFIVSSFSFTIALLYGLLRVKESVETEAKPKNRCLAFFDLDHIVCIVQTTFKKRDNYRRAQILLVILSVTTCGLAAAGKTLADISLPLIHNSLVKFKISPQNSPSIRSELHL